MKKTCKSIIRRTLSFMVTAAMCLSLLPGAVFAGDETGAVPNETAESSLVQVDKATEEQHEESEEVTEPDADVPNEEGKDEAKEEVKTEEPKPDEGEGKEDSEDKTASEEDPSDDEEKEEPAEHVHNEDGWSCAWSECIHEHGPECYVPGEDGEDVLNCAHVCGEECLANTEGFWICTEPEEETPVYATVEELEAAFEAVGETDGVDEALAAIDEYLRIFDLLSPEDQEANAEAKEAALAYRQTLEDSKEGIPNEEIETLALISGESFTVKVVKVVNGNQVDEVTLTKKCLQSTGHSGYNHSTNLRDLANSSGFSGYKGYNWSKYTTVPSSYTSGLAPNNNYASVHYNITGSAPYKADETLFLFFEETKTFTLKYDANGGSGAPSQQTATSTGTSYRFTISGTKPTRSDYTFKGWSTNRNATSPTYFPNGTIDVTSTTTLYAVWEKNPEKVTLTYNGNGHTQGTPPEAVTVDKGKEVTIRNNNNRTMLRTDYEFLGWSTDKNATLPDSKWAPGTPVILNANTTLYAVWKKVESNPAISVTKEVVGESTVKPGDEVTFKITVKNTGNVAFTMVAVSDTLPDGLTFGKATGNPMLTTPSIVWVLNDVAAGATQEFTITAKVEANATGKLTNTVNVMGQTSNNAQVKGSDTADVTVEETGGNDPGTKTGNFTVVKSFTGLDAGVTGPKVTLTYEAWRTKDDAMVGEKESGSVILTLDGNKYTGIITPTVWSILTSGEGAMQDSDRPRYKNVVVITEDLSTAEMDGYTWKSFSAFYPADGTNEGDDTVEFKMDGATFQKDLLVKNAYAKDVVNPKLTSIEKKLLGVTVNDGEETTDVNNLSVTKGDKIVLRYQITVKGDKNANYIVTDNDVTVESGSLQGTIGDNGEAVIVVSKTVTATEAGKLTVSNTAYVKPDGDGTDPINPTDPEQPDGPDGHPSDEVKTEITVKEPNPKLTGISKSLKSPAQPITVKRGESVTLEYEITVTGEKGAKYEVSDPEASDTTWKGTINESGKAVITVSKTITPTEEQKGTITVKNTAYVKPDGDGTDPIKPGDPDPDKDPTDPEKGYPSNEVETEITIIEPNPKLKSIVKKLVTSEPITVRVGENVTLEYTITITGDEGAEYEVTDDGAELKDGSSWDGKLGESGEAVITVTKTVTPTEAGTMTVENTAFVKPGEGTDPIKPVDPENPDEPVEPEPSNTVTTEITVTDGREITITWLLGYGDNEVYGDVVRAPAGTEEVDIRLYPANTPIREGYTFTGWGTPVIDSLTGNITITAQWRENRPDPNPTTPTGPINPTPGGFDTDDDSDPDPDPDPTPVRTVTVNVPDAPTPLAEIGETPVPLASNPSDLIDIFDDDVPLAGGVGTGNNDALWYLLAALSLAGLGLVKLLEKKNTTK